MESGLPRSRPLIVAARIAVDMTAVDGSGEVGSNARKVVAAGAGDPVSPFAPAGPVAPASPFGPGGPASPRSPLTPCGPAGPCAPASPCGPADPGGPPGPCAPVGPWGPAVPCGPEGPAGPCSAEQLSSRMNGRIMVSSFARMKLPLAWVAK